MHQSIPAVPIPTPPPPRVTVGHLLTLSVRGVGYSQFYRGPGGWALAYPRDDPQLCDTHVFKRQVSLSGRMRPLSKTGLSHQGLEKLQCFLRYVFLILDISSLLLSI